jgi:hypothetical protein
VTIDMAKALQAAAYRQRLDQWEQAWYCRKHDVVILGDSKVLSPAEFRSLMTGEA